LSERFLAAKFTLHLSFLFKKGKVNLRGYAHHLFREYKSWNMLSLERLHTLSVDSRAKGEGAKIVTFLGSPVKKRGSQSLLSLGRLLTLSVDAWDKGGAPKNDVCLSKVWEPEFCYRKNDCTLFRLTHRTKVRAPNGGNFCQKYIN